MVETVEGFMGNGLKIDHLIEVDFEDFPEFIDAMGGVTVNNKTKICAPEFDNFFRGFNLKKGRRELNGRRALGFARVRKNPCAIAENDLNRAERQQEVLNGIRGQLLSASTFFRLPLISWKAPKTIRTDLRGPGLLALAADIATGGSGEPAVLQPSVFGDDLEFSDAEKASAVQELLGEG
jgi:LCP family protein required for cell wall assembly